MGDGSAEQSVCLVRHYFDERGVARPHLDRELAKADEIIKASVSVELKPHQYEALRSLLSDLVGGYAKGSTRFEQSCLLFELNKGHLNLAASEFFGFCHRSKAVDQRLWDKRRAEQILFRTGILTLK